jgi:translation initiation factor 3 subunit J
MADNWEDADEDDWDQDDDEINAKLGLKTDGGDAIPKFDDEQDLAVAERAQRERLEHLELKKKGTALQEKKALEKEQREAVELAKKAMELEAEIEANMSPEELKTLKQRQIEEADHALTDDLFDNVDKSVGPSASSGVAAKAGDKVIMRDLVDHLKHARKVAECCKAHGKIHLTLGFLKECLEQCKDVLDDDAITDIIKSCNIIKNEKLQAAKKMKAAGSKGQAQKAKKVDKQAVAKARQVQVETFGDNDNYDDYDAIGADYEDAFF